MRTIYRGLVAFICFAAGITIVLVTAGRAPLAQGQIPAPIAEEAPTLVCYQNGRQIFQVGPLSSISQAGGEAYLDFRHENGARGQVRIIGSAVCLVTANPPAPSAKK
jgi:hypothetical protein